jgi:hypothetical protein
MMDADRFSALNRLRGDCRVFAPRSKGELVELALDHGLPPAVAAQIATQYDPRKGAESLPRVEWRDEPEGDNLLAVLQMFNLED